MFLQVELDNEEEGAKQVAGDADVITKDDSDGEDSGEGLSDSGHEDMEGVLHAHLVKQPFHGNTGATRAWLTVV